MNKLLLLTISSFMFIGCDIFESYDGPICEDPKAINYNLISHNETLNESCSYCESHWNEWNLDNYPGYNVDSVLFGYYGIGHHSDDFSGCCFIDGAINQNTNLIAFGFFTDQINTQDSTYCIFE